MVDTLINTIKYALMVTFVLFVFMAYKNAAFAEDGVAYIPVVEGRIEKGEIITESQVRMMPYEERRVSDYIITDKAELVGMEATRTLRENMPVHTRSVRVAPYGRKGEVMMLTYKKSGMTLQAEARLLDDANLGDVVQVETLNSRARITGRITGKGMIEVN